MKTLFLFLMFLATCNAEIANLDSGFTERLKNARDSDEIKKDVMAILDLVWNDREGHLRINDEGKDLLQQIERMVLLITEKKEASIKLEGYFLARELLKDGLLSESAKISLRKSLADSDSLINALIKNTNFDKGELICRVEGFLLYKEICSTDKMVGPDFIYDLEKFSKDVLRFYVDKGFFVSGDKAGEQFADLVLSISHNKDLIEESMAMLTRRDLLKRHPEVLSGSVLSYLNMFHHVLGPLAKEALLARIERVNVLPNEDPHEHFESLKAALRKSIN